MLMQKYISSLFGVQLITKQVNIYSKAEVTITLTVNTVITSRVTFAPTHLALIFFLNRGDEKPSFF